MGGNENESWKEEIYYTCLSQWGFNQMPPKATGQAQGFSQVAEDRRKGKS